MGDPVALVTPRKPGHPVDFAGIATEFGFQYIKEPPGDFDHLFGGLDGRRYHKGRIHLEQMAVTGSMTDQAGHNPGAGKSCQANPSRGQVELFAQNSHPYAFGSGLRSGGNLKYPVLPKPLDHPPRRVPSKSHRVDFPHRIQFRRSAG